MDANTFTYLRARQRGAAARPLQARTIASHPKRRSFLGRIFSRGEVTTFHRCLAVHMHYAQRNSLLR